HLRRRHRALAGRRRGRSVHVGEHADLDDVVRNLRRCNCRCQHRGRKRPEHGKSSGVHPVSSRYLRLAGRYWFKCQTFSGRRQRGHRTNAGASVVDFAADSGHTAIMSNPQRLPTSLTPLDVALSALSALLRELKPVATSERASPDTTGCGAVEISELKAWPPHDVAAVDGWALRVSDLVGASSYSPLLLTTPPVWVESGERIPDGCDCVLDDDCVDRTGPMAQVLAEAIPGQGIRRKGREIADASRVVNAWRTGDLHPAARRPRLRMVNIPGGIITAKLIAASLC